MEVRGCWDEEREARAYDGTKDTTRISYRPLLYLLLIRKLGLSILSVRTYFGTDISFCLLTVSHLFATWNLHTNLRFLRRNGGGRGSRVEGSPGHDTWWQIIDVGLFLCSGCDGMETG